MKLSLLVLSAALITAPQPPPDRQLPVDKPGRHRAPDGSCPVRLTVSGKGGFLQLHLPSKRARVVKDVTGVLFVQRRRLVYSVSSIYGRPGIFAFDCRTGRTRRLVRPRLFDRAFPDGRDYFELAWQEGDGIYFYYGDLGRIDFTRFRQPDHLYVTDLVQGGMRRADGPSR